MLICKLTIEISVDKDALPIPGQDPLEHIRSQFNDFQRAMGYDCDFSIQGKISSLFKGALGNSFTVVMYGEHGIFYARDEDGEDQEAKQEHPKG